MKTRMAISPANVRTPFRVSEPKTATWNQLSPKYGDAFGRLVAQRAKPSQGAPIRPEEKMDKKKKKMNLAISH